MLVFIAARDVDAGFILVCILDALELHTQILVIVPRHRYPVLLHPVHDEFGDGDGAAADIRQFLPHVHGEEIVDGLTDGSLAVGGNEIVHLRLL